MSGVVQALAWAGLACAALPLAMTTMNLGLYRRPRAPAAALGVEDAVDVCIPARNESANIEACVAGVLASRGVPARALVYDDQSTDETPVILARLAVDPRVVRVPTQPLPEGWNGKQWGCDRMGRASDAPWLLFTDADVRLSPDAVASAVEFARRGGSDLVSTVPREICGSVGEALVVPLIHFMLLGYLPMAAMRRDRRAAFGAGCGQFLLVRREAWTRAGGHAAFRDSMHDGIKLPRAVRQSGGRTDLFDGTPVVSCRMYRGFAQTWRGFAKNAYEGLGSPVALLFFTGLHLVGHVTPWGIVAAWFVGAGVPRESALVAAGAIGCGMLARALLAARFRQPWIGVALHPFAMLLVTAIQWHSLWLARTGRRAWRGRVAGA